MNGLRLITKENPHPNRGADFLYTYISYARVLRHLSCLGLLRLHEVLLRLEQVAALEYHRLSFVEDGQVEHTCLGRGGVVLDTTQLVLDGLCNQVEELVTHRQHEVDVSEVVGLQHIVDAGVEFRHGVVDGGEVYYNTDIKQATTLEETLSAYLFVVTAVKNAGLTISKMNEKEVYFINNWEAEKYRRSVK